MLHEGWKDIAALFGKCNRTVRGWYYDYKMPVLRTPSGRPAMTDEMAERWLLALAEKYKKNPKHYPNLRPRRRLPKNRTG